MPISDKKTVVNSWNEWDPLRHVIVGRADDSQVPPLEPAVDGKVPVDSEMRQVAGTRRSEESIARANEQLDNFADMLTGRGIRVDRPRPLDFTTPSATPDWQVESMFGCMPPRDVLLTVGKEILEATLTYRCRWFEYLCYRDLLQSYFNDDPGMRWESVPKPRLSDASYRASFKQEASTNEGKLKLLAERHYVTTEAEPMFDAAEVMRMGKDLFVQHGNTANLQAVNWLARHYPEHRVHALNFFGDDPYTMHIDATFVPLRPGLIVNNPGRSLSPEQRKIFDMNDWQIVPTARPVHDQAPPMCYSGVYLSMNCLVLDPKTVCIEASEVHQQEQMDQLGFEVIPVPFRDVYPFGGGLHCSTADVYREGQLEDYFPRQMPV